MCSYLENSGIHKFQKDPDKSKTCIWISNVIVHSLSRRDKVIQTEWSLYQQIFNQICSATPLNHKLPIYVSPVPDKKAWKIDALNIRWEGLDGYVFCPVAILPQVIQKIITYPCWIIVLAPGWPGMPFGIWWISRPGYPYSFLTGRHYSNNHAPTGSTTMWNT